MCGATPADESFKGLERRLRCDAFATGVGDAASAALRLLGSGLGAMGAVVVAAVRSQGEGGVRRGVQAGRRRSA